VKQDMLRTTLNLFGDELLAMVPEGDQKKILQKRYQEFLSQAEADQVAEEDIARVATNILNLSNQDTVISAKAAMNVLRIGEKEEKAPGRLSRPPVLRDMGVPAVPLSEKSKKEFQDRHERREKLAERLQNLQRFNEAYYQLLEQDTSSKATLPRYVFTADSGFFITLPDNFRSQKLDHHFIELKEHLKRLENDELVKYQADMEEMKKAERRARRALIKIFQAQQVNTITDSLGSTNLDSLQKTIKIRTDHIDLNE
jgi:hypothetical protein